MEDIRKALVSSGGWIASDIDVAIAAAKKSPDIGAPVFTPGGNSTKYAGFWIRFIALMVDAMIISVPIAAFRFAVLIGTSSYGGLTNALMHQSSAGASPQDIAVNLLASLASALAGFAYFIFLTYYKGATLGKMLVGIQVRNEDLTRLSFGKVVLRETIGRIISQLPLDAGYIMAAFTDRKRGLHDIISGSVVVYKDPAQKHTGRIVLAAIIGLIIPILSLVAIFGILASVVLVSLNSTHENAARSSASSAFPINDPGNSLIAQMTGNAQAKADDARAISDISQIRTAMETLFDTKTSKYQTGSDCRSGVFTADNVAPLVADIGQKGMLPHCIATADAYALSVDLKAPASGPAFCLDSRGATGYHGIDASSISPQCAKE